MYLVDTNVWLESILEQVRAAEVREFMRRVEGRLLAITEFSIHSACVILSRLGQNGDNFLFRSADKARHGKLVELVTRMLDLKKRQSRAPKKQSPSARQLLDQKLAIPDQQIDELVDELYGLTEDEIRIVEGEQK